MTKSRAPDNVASTASAALLNLPRACSIRAFALFNVASDLPVNENVVLTSADLECVERLHRYYEKLTRFFTDHQQAFKNFSMEPRQNVILIRLPEFDQDVHDLDGLKGLADRFKNSEIQKESLS